jgi:hypothetical protein
MNNNNIPVRNVKLDLSPQHQHQFQNPSHNSKKNKKKPSQKSKKRGGIERLFRLLESEKTKRKKETAVFRKSFGSCGIRIKCRTKTESESASDGRHIGGLKLHGEIRVMKGTT